MNFGQAIEAMKDGEKVARDGWNGKGMFMYLVRGSIVNSLRGEAATHLGQPAEGDGQVINGHIDMKAADGSITVGWAPSQVDMLANDWGIIDTRETIRIDGEQIPVEDVRKR